MNHRSLDPFEVAYENDVEDEEQQDTAPPLAVTSTANDNVDDELTSIATNEEEEDDDEEEEEDTMDIDVSKVPSSNDPEKLAKMGATLSKFTPEQMARYEKFRGSKFNRPQIRRLIIGVTGNPKLQSSAPETIVVSSITKMFVGELVETARMVMNERKETGPTRPCHIREAYRRLKREGKMLKRSAPRLFR